MSELKVHKAYNRWLDEEMPTPNDDLICNEVYLKSEADKFIADLEESHKKEVGQLLIEIAELKNGIEKQKRLRDMALASVPNVLKVMKIIQYNKYKRCLAMAYKCEAWIRLDVSPRHTHRFIRWYKIWLAIAEKFKEAK